jgi:hypothetical protein
MPGGNLMLDLNDPLALDDVPDVIVYRDAAAKTAFYALPARPRIAMDEQGTPQLSLMAYGKRTQAGFKATGGILTLTTALQLMPEETQRVRASLTKRLARDFPQPPDTPPLEPELRPIEWLKGSVELTLVPGVSLTGSPSLFGGNQCAFSANLDARQIEPLLKAWKKRLPGSSITYRLAPNTGGPASGTTHVSTFESWTANGVERRTSESTTEHRGRPAATSELELKGPVMPAGTKPADFLNITSL